MKRRRLYQPNIHPSRPYPYRGSSYVSGEVYTLYVATDGSDNNWVGFISHNAEISQAFEDEAKGFLEESKITADIYSTRTSNDGSDFQVLVSSKDAEKVAQGLLDIAGKHGVITADQQKSGLQQFCFNSATIFCSTFPPSVFVGMKTNQFSNKLELYFDSTAVCEADQAPGAILSDLLGKHLKKSVKIGHVIAGSATTDTWILNLEPKQGISLKEAALELLTFLKDNKIPGKHAPMMSQARYDEAIVDLRLTELAKARAGGIGGAGS